jgi:inner membrane transporter RhtA
MRMTDLRVAPGTPADQAIARRGGGRGVPRPVAVAMVCVGAFSVESGAAVATLLFHKTGPAGACALRLVISAVVLLLVCRPTVRGYRRSDWGVILAFGCALAGMNMLYYQAIARIPLAAAVTLEVLGPLTLSVVAARRATGWLAAATALVGVVLFGHAGFHDLNVAGVAYALGAATMWAAYILTSQHTGRRFPKADGLALAMAVASVLTLPFGIVDAGSALLAPANLGLGLVVAVLASVLPYTLELLALRRLAASTFGVLMSLTPAAAAIAGFVLLGQRLTPLEILAIALVIAANAGAVRASAT